MKDRRRFWSIRLVVLLLLRPPITVSSLVQSTISRSLRHSNYDVILMDVENIRGQSGFSYTHHDFFESVRTWISRHELQGRVCLVMDHGSQASSFYLNPCAIVFSGPLAKADDVILTDALPYFQPPHKVCLVTADRQLMQRCLRVHNQLTILPPMNLLNDLEQLPHQDLLDQLNRGSTPPASKSQYFDWEVSILAQLVSIERQYVISHKNKQRKAFKYKAEQLRKRLSSSTLLHRLHDLMVQGPTRDTLQGLDAHQQQIVIDSWHVSNKAFRRHKERTADRIVMAEQLRDELMAQQLSSDADNGTVTSVVQAYVQWRKNPMKPRPAVVSTTTQSLRLVVVSDTHGFHEQFRTLPEGDVLLHLGDFAANEVPAYETASRLDAWLAQQAHPTKIVLRGNHDPRRMALEHATYITKPTVLKLGGYSFAFVPYMGRGMSNRSIPKTCDVLVSHAPPQGLLDRSVSGQSAGSQVLRRGLDRMRGGPPALVLCGHIHEGRGSIHHVFCGNDETLVINAANANVGPAVRLDHGPVVVDLNAGSSKRKLEVKLLEMHGRYEYLNVHERFFFQQYEDESRSLLLAVDLGLRTGLSLFDSLGKLIRFENFHFGSSTDLEMGVETLLKDWEAFSVVPIGRVAIEGLDTTLQTVWKQLVGERLFLNVSPEEWRRDLLLNAEQRSGVASKAASQWIAKQVVEDYGTMPVPRDEIQTDAAESILLGLHVARRLGWIQREPAIRRSECVDTYEHAAAAAATADVDAVVAG